MSFPVSFRLYIVALILFFVFDMVWLGFLAKGLYQNEIGFLMADNIRWSAAILFYLLYLFGVVFFAVMPSIEKNSLGLALAYGALFGLICYASYDLTNLATIKGWPVTIVFYDILWGTFISSATSFITAAIGLVWK